MDKTYRIITYGCQMNMHESEKIAGMLENEGYVRSDNDDIADVVVLNTCCVRETAETRVTGNLGILKKSKELKPDMKIIVCGCMTQSDGTAQKLKERCPFIFAILGTHNIDRLPEILRDGHNGKTYVEITDKTKINEDMPVKRTSGINAWVNIMYGCNNFCSYCIVPYVRGRERSREKKHIIADVKKLVSVGYKQITLLGQNVNSYGNDLNGSTDDFPSLLRDLSAIDGKFRIKFMTSHPKDIVPETVDAISESDKLSHFIHMPAQSGSDRILGLMNRKYTSADYLSKIDMIKNAIPDAGLSGDIMVGFPTETERDFADTVDLVSAVKYSNLYTFIYSRRKGTPAANMEGQVPTADKKRRIAELIKRQAQIACGSAVACVGRSYEILCSEHKNGKIVGETICGKAVLIDGDASMVGKFINAKIVKNVNSKLYGAIN